MEKMSSIVRRQFKEGDDIRDAGLTTPEDVIRYDDIAYGKDSDSGWNSYKGRGIKLWTVQS